MAYGTVQSKTNMSTGDSTNITATFDTPPAEHNLCVAVAMHTDVDVLDNIDQNGWGEYAIATGAYCVVYAWSKTAGPDESSDFGLASNSAVTWAVWMREYDGNTDEAYIEGADVDSDQPAGETTYELQSTIEPQGNSFDISLFAFAQNGSAETVVSFSDDYVLACDLQPTGTVLGSLAVADKPLTDQTPPHCLITLTGAPTQDPSKMLITLAANPAAGNSRIMQQSNSGS